jgi:flagellar motility protein MotE (MotC chaperone)
VKSSLAYIVVFIGSLISAALVVSIVMYLKPELFTSPTAEPAAAPVSRTDTAKAVAPKPKEEPPHRQAGPTMAELTRKDTARNANRDVTALRDSLQHLNSALEQERQKNRAAVSDTQVRDSSALARPDTAGLKDQKSFAKVLEAMQAENAARILKDLPDQDVKRILLNIKKRQAAKIIAGLDPDRVARIMR